MVNNISQDFYSGQGDIILFELVQIFISKDSSDCTYNKGPILKIGYKVQQDNRTEFRVQILPYYFQEKS